MPSQRWTPRTPNSEDKRTHDMHTHVRTHTYMTHTLGQRLFTANNATGDGIPAIILYISHLIARRCSPSHNYTRGHHRWPTVVVYFVCGMPVFPVKPLPRLSTVVNVFGGGIYIEMLLGHSVSACVEFHSRPLSWKPPHWDHMCAFVSLFTINACSCFFPRVFCVLVFCHRC